MAAADTGALPELAVLPPPPVLETIGLIRQHSADLPQECFCRCSDYLVGERGRRESDLRLGCGCCLHFLCLEQYCVAKLRDAALVNAIAGGVEGLPCPCATVALGADGCQYDGAEPYWISADDLDLLIAYGERHVDKEDMDMGQHGGERLTRELVNLMRTGHVGTVRPLETSLPAAVADALSLECPSETCRAKLPEFMPDPRDNCCAAKCEDCGLFFCWFCFLVANPPTFEVRHNHVRRCIFNPNDNGDLFLLPASRIAPIHLHRRIEAVRRALARHNADWFTSAGVHAELSSEPLADLLRDRGITSELLFASQEVEPQRGEVDRDDVYVPHLDLDDIQEEGLVDILLEHLYNASQFGDEDTVRGVLDQLGELDIGVRRLDRGRPQDGGRNALHVSAERGHANIVHMLLSEPPHAFDVDSTDDMGRTALYFSAWEGHAEVASVLVIRHRANVNKHDLGIEVQSPLQLASWGGHDDIARLLFTAGANVDFQDRRGRVALHHACKKGRESTVRLLLEECHAAVDVANLLGATPLHWACGFGREAIVRILLDFGAMPFAVDVSGLMPIDWAKDRQHLGVVEVMQRTGRRPRRQKPAWPLSLLWDSPGMVRQSDLVEACLHKDLPLLRAIIGRDSKPAASNVRDKNPALQAAVRCYNVAGARLLLENGASVNARDAHGYSALEVACELPSLHIAAYADETNLEMIMLLLWDGADIGCDVCGCVEDDRCGEKVCWCDSCDRFGCIGGMPPVILAAVRESLARLELREGRGECVYCGCSAELSSEGERECFCSTCQESGCRPLSKTMLDVLARRVGVVKRADANCVECGCSREWAAEGREACERVCWCDSCRNVGCCKLEACPSCLSPEQLSALAARVSAAEPEPEPEPEPGAEPDARAALPPRLAPAQLAVLQGLL